MHPLGYKPIPECLGSRPDLEIFEAALQLRYVGGLALQNIPEAAYVCIYCTSRLINLQQTDSDVTSLQHRERFALLQRPACVGLAAVIDIAP